MAKIISRTPRKSSSGSSSEGRAAPRRPRTARTRAKAAAASPSQNLARTVAQLALTKKAFDVTIVDLRELSAFTDFFVICSGATEIQVRAIARAIDDGLRAAKVRPHHVEGQGQAQWMLLDYLDVVVHVMQPRVRDYYGLEDLWADAPREEVAD